MSVELEFADKRGTFFGTLTFNKQDFGILLVQEGLAQVNIVGNKAPHNLYQLEDAEDQAKEEGRGIWDKNLKLMT